VGFYTYHPAVAHRELCHAHPRPYLHVQIFSCGAQSFGAFDGVDIAVSGNEVATLDIRGIEVWCQPDHLVLVDKVGFYTIVVGMLDVLHVGDHSFGSQGKE
jgi:hypothetical protein